MTRPLTLQAHTPVVIVSYRILAFPPTYAHTHAYTHPLFNVRHSSKFEIERPVKGGEGIKIRTLLAGTQDAHACTGCVLDSRGGSAYAESSPRMDGKKQKCRFLYENHVIYVTCRQVLFWFFYTAAATTILHGKLIDRQQREISRRYQCKPGTV